MKAIAGLLLLLALLSPGTLPPGQDLNPGYWERSVLPQMGIATYYAPGIMEYVVSYRVSHGQLPQCEDCVGAVALLRAGDIGRKVWLQPPGGQLAGPFLVVDCARPEDIPPLLDRDWAVDVSYELGQLWGLAGPLPGVIVWADPAEGNAPAPAAEPTRFYVDPRDVVITAPTPAGIAPPTVPLPTRLPAPRGTPGVPAPATPAQSPVPPLTPVVTTPTPPGYQAPAAPPAGSGSGASTAPGAPTPASGQAPVQVPAQGEPGVALGRPGQELLAAARPATAARPAGVATPLPPTTLRPPTAAPSSTPPASAVTAAPILPALTRPALPVAQGGGGNLFERFWRALQGLFGGR